MDATCVIFVEKNMAITVPECHDGMLNECRDHGNISPNENGEEGVLIRAPQREDGLRFWITSSACSTEVPVNPARVRFWAHSAAALSALAVGSIDGCRALGGVRRSWLDSLHAGIATAAGAHVTVSLID